MRILGIETSCDETAVAVVMDGVKVEYEAVISQIKQHKQYGGVFPELASRLHCEYLPQLLDKVNLDNIDGVAVTYGPGLEGSLLVGMATAKVISSRLGIPLIGVNHLMGHIYSPLIESKKKRRPNFPFVSLIISGGHTSLVLVKGHFDLEVLGETRDDAVGEAFDKVARMLGLGYPGGPEVEKMAINGKGDRFRFPRPMKQQKNEFSFSGLKTAVAQEVYQHEKVSMPVEDLCAGFQAAVVEVLTEKTMMACKDNNVDELVVCGGVSANMTIREAFQKSSKEHSSPFLFQFVLVYQVFFFTIYFLTDHTP